MNNFLRRMFFSTLICFGAISLAAGNAYYVVIGTFSKEDKARQFKTAVARIFAEASVTYDSAKDFYYVHVMKTNRIAEAEEYRHYLRVENGFGSAWIFADFDAQEPSVYASANPSNDYIAMELYTGGSLLLGSTDKSLLSVTKRNWQVKDTTLRTVEKSLSFVAVTSTGVKVPGKVSLMNSSGRALSSFKTGEIVTFAGQTNDVVTLVCEVDGYNTEIKLLDMGNLSNVPHTRKNEEGVWEVEFPVTRLRVNEVTLLYHRVFYPEAAVLQPESKKQIDVLRSLVTSNPGWRIVINSHCNAGEKRDIMVPDKGSDYFNIEEAREKSGSDKKLTTERAATLRDYLVGHGIDGDRITVLGWGSLDLLVKGADAEVNERVEVELVGG